MLKKSALSMTFLGLFMTSITHLPMQNKRKIYDSCFTSSEKCHRAPQSPVLILSILLTALPLWIHGINCSQIPVGRKDMPVHQYLLRFHMNHRIDYFQNPNQGGSRNYRRPHSVVFTVHYPYPWPHTVFLHYLISLFILLLIQLFHVPVWTTILTTC